MPNKDKVSIVIHTFTPPLNHLLWIKCHMLVVLCSCIFIQVQGVDKTSKEFVAKLLAAACIQNGIICLRSYKICTSLNNFRYSETPHQFYIYLCQLFTCKRTGARPFTFMWAAYQYVFLLYSDFFRKVFFFNY